MTGKKPLHYTDDILSDVRACLTAYTSLTPKGTPHMSALSEREARFALSLVTEPGSPDVTKLVAEHGAVGAWHKMPDHTRDVDPRGLLARASNYARFLIPDDEDWPASFDDLTAGTITIGGIGGPPLGIWLRGPGSLTHFAERSVAIVGARASTPYGEGVATDIAADLAAADVGVVSGAAYGIDSAAHRGALAVNGPTLAVQACGVDVTYPRGNADLINTIATTQLIMTEAPPGSYPTRAQFLARNRLIAAISGATLIVEATTRSGARTTTDWTQSLIRPLLAVPGPITAPTSNTPNHLIHTKQARLATGAPDILNALNPTNETTHAH